MEKTPEPPVRLLVIEDEPPMRRLLKTALGAHGYRLSEAASGGEGLRLAAMELPALIVLDLGLPDLDGLEVIRRLREWSDAGIVVLTARGRDADKVAALDLGADDYVTKPFSMPELLARLRAALRHRTPREAAEPVFARGGLAVDLAKRQVTLDGRRLSLTPKEYDLLRVLVVNAGRVLTHQQLLRQVWGQAYAGETRSLRVYINQLRQKIEPDPARPAYILTETGVGYRLAADDD